MKHESGSRAALPRIKVLPACLSVALAISWNGLLAAYASADATGSHPSPGHGSFIAAAPRPGLSSVQRQALIERMRQVAPAPILAPTTAIPVINCDDSGPGSLRDAFINAVSGDIIDLTHTGCSLITLSTGGLSTSAGSLTLLGPGVLALAIDGDDAFRPIQHTGSGVLSVNDLRIQHGKKYVASGDSGNPDGACIQSSGTVSIQRSWVKYCDAGSSSTTIGVKGGAIYAKVGAVVSDSIVSSSTAHSSGSFARGGGVYSAGILSVNHSTISANVVSSSVSHADGGGAEVGPASQSLSTIAYSTIYDNSATGASGSFGGGLYTTGNVTILNSTLSGNQADVGGALYLRNTVGVNSDWSLRSSTISGNNAILAGGIYIGNHAMKIENSTIAFNTAHTTTKYGAGLSICCAVAVDLQSTIVANNTTDEGGGPLPDDIGGRSGASLSGANDLIIFSGLASPAGTLVADPLLKTLSDNGGPTKTHALAPTSPAIDIGNNAAFLSVDQRGTGHARMSGAGPDIGAFEFDKIDLIFANGFD